MPRITRLETFANEFLAFVRVTCDDGSFGWGQTSNYNADITATVFHRQIAPWALGADPMDIPGLIARIERKEHKFPGTYRCRALAGLDTALWDWRGRVEEKPVVALLDGTPGPLRAYASSMRRDISPEAEADRLKHLLETQGFDAVKFRIGAECGNDRDEWSGRTETIIPHMARAFDSQVDLLVDANSGFSVSRAITIGHLLEDHGICHFEEPVPYWELDQTAEVAAALQVDVSGGEQDWDMATWKRMIALRAVDILQPDVMYMGGICRTLEVARLGAAAGLPCTPHAANLSLVTICTMHLLQALPNPGKYLEFSIEGDDYYPWQRGLFLGDPFRVQDGKLTVTDAPGWGVEINPDWLAQASYQETAAEGFRPSAYQALYQRL